MAKTSSKVSKPVKKDTKKGKAKAVEPESSSSDSSSDESGSSSDESDSSSGKNSSSDSSDSDEEKPVKKTTKSEKEEESSSESEASSSDSDSGSSDSDSDSSSSDSESDESDSSDSESEEKPETSKAEAKEEENSSSTASSDSSDSESEEDSKPKKEEKESSSSDSESNSDSDSDSDSESESESSSDDSDSDSSSSDSESESEKEESTKETKEPSNKRKEEFEEEKPAVKKQKSEEEPATLFVGRLSWNIDDEWLRREFEPLGGVLSARVIMERATGKSRGYGYVDFSSKSAAEKALNEYQGREIDGRPINLDMSTGKPHASNPKVERAKQFGDVPSAPSDTLFIGNLSFNAQRDNLFEVFGEYGTVLSCRLPTHPDTQQPKGFGYVQMSSIDEARAALEALNGEYVEGRAVRLDFSTPKSNVNSPRPAFGRGRERGNTASPRPARATEFKGTKKTFD